MKAAIKSAAADGKITEAEAESIDVAAKAANMSDEEISAAVTDELEKKGSK